MRWLNNCFYKIIYNKYNLQCKTRNNFDNCNVFKNKGADANFIIQMHVQNEKVNNFITAVTSHTKQLTLHGARS